MDPNTLAVIVLGIVGATAVGVERARKDGNVERAKVCNEIVYTLYPHHHKDYIRDYMVQCMKNGVNSIIPREKDLQ